MSKSTAPSAADLARYRANLRDEIDGSVLYAALAEAERDPVRKDLFGQLARAEGEHAQFWRDKLHAAGLREVPARPSLRTRVLAALARRLGVRYVLPAIAAAETADSNKYAEQADAQALAADEQGHAAVVRSATSSGVSPTIGADIARAEPWHRGASGNDLRAAVLGGNDGLVSNFCLVMGVAGAGAAGTAIVTTGLAGLVAGACSMALGEWLSVTNARELARTQMAREREEIEQTPEAEQKELALIYQAKGLAKADAQRVAARIMRDKDAALETLAREELGIDPQELGGSPARAAASSFLLFALGAVVPVAPFLLAHGTTAVVACVVASGVVLALTGAATSLFNGRSAWFSAARQVAFGCAAAAVTYGVGTVLGVSVS
jgi:VIT1/CCC1 family predicted Fe2+/Mn2+ transporter